MVHIKQSHPSFFRSELTIFAQLIDNVGIGISINLSVFGARRFMFDLANSQLKSVTCLLPIFADDFPVRCAAHLSLHLTICRSGHSGLGGLARGIRDLSGGVDALAEVVD